MNNGNYVTGYLPDENHRKSSLKKLVIKILFLFLLVFVLFLFF